MTIFLLLLATLISACSDAGSYTTAEGISPDTPMQISVLTSQQTKGEIVNEPADMGSIGLYCALTGSLSWMSTTKFNKLSDECYYSVDGVDWLSDGVDVSWGFESFDDKYTFFAYSPHSGETQGVKPEIEAGELVIEYTVPTSSVNQPDLMYAQPRKDISPQIAGYVPLTFYHTLSCVGFEVLSVPDRTITAIEIRGVVNTGVLSWDYELNLPKWEYDELVDYSNESFSVNVEGYTLDDDNSAQLNSDQGYLMMIPQTLSSGAEVVVTLEGEEPKSLMIPANSVWEAGVKYQYIIRLNDAECDIVFNTTQLSNCYIINPTIGEPTVIQIPIEDRINDFWLNYTDDAAKKIKSGSETEEFSVSMVWEDFDESLSFGYTVLDDIDNKMAVKLSFDSQYQQGNVVFAVEDEDGNILWSWHLWFTSYNPDAIAEANRDKIAADIFEYEYGDYTGAVHRYVDAADSLGLWSGIYKDKFIMDRNIGERNDFPEDFGAGSVYYEFGRKDPFPGSSYTFGSYPYSLWIRSVSYCTFERSVELSRDIIFSSSSSSSNWSGEGYARDTTVLWYDKNILVKGYDEGKSIFDPSPLGWRVPVKHTWSDSTIIDGENSVGVYANYGYRDCTNSAILTKDTKAMYVWSANMIDSQTGYCFSYSGSNTSALSSLAVANCLPIRAIEE